MHDKPDSTGICFIGERPFREFLAGWLRPEPGPIETPEGQRLGEHRGVAFYTLGQRGGLEIGGRAGCDDQPWYVAAKDAARNALVVVQGHDHPLLFSGALVTEPAHWLAEAAGRRVRVPGEAALSPARPGRPRQPGATTAASRCASSARSARSRRARAACSTRATAASAAP